ncbi:Putative regulator of cell autolysis [Aquiflexum balticum DSM 16537]|uniref:Putative regulator of cell autolysis n=1 Tax=Aquiflexum balticum DSM 16537 TaxID=758820 RepID=A0A1W2H8H8_9BACT|nr:histidine kinase [Aquiflexum balticum]SMD45180.1 Putative regulator of cell autolysis [Aquiflexum balticum DSM 16537]
MKTVKNQSKREIALNSLNNLGLILGRYKVHHLLFWAVYYVFWVSVYQGFYQNFNHLLLVTGFYTISNAGMYYIPQYVLIPKLMKGKGMLLFFPAFFLLAAFLSVFMKTGIALALNLNLEEFFKASTLQILGVYFSSNVFTGAILLAIKGFLENRKTIRQNELKEKERIESELNFLKSQVNPHFLFNAINSVYVLIRMDPDKASETLIKLSNLLRSQLYEFTTDSIDIQQELEYLENYVELEKIRKGDRLKVVFEKGEGLEDFSIAPLLLIPFLENCFKHLSSHTDKENLVKVQITYANGRLMANFFNTKENQKMQAESVQGGIGLKNIKRRLEILYPKKHILETIERSDSFEVKLEIKVNED